jgi:hypothetical protein
MATILFHLNRQKTLTVLRNKVISSPTCKFRSSSDSTVMTDRIVDSARITNYRTTVICYGRVWLYPRPA